MKIRPLPFLIILVALVGVSVTGAQTPVSSVKKRLVEIPPQVVTLRQFCLPTADQGVLPASGAYALCSCLSIERNLQKGMKDSLTFSASFLFNSLKQGQNCEQGIRISEALRFLEKQGVCPTAIFPNSRYDCETPPVVPQKSLHRIKGTNRLFNQKEEVMKKVEAVQGALDNSHPVIIVLSGNLGFDALASASDDWRLVPTDPNDNATSSYEAMVVVGYDKTSRTFELMGSYGQNWGDNGFAHIAFEDFGKVVRYGFTLDTGKFKW